MALSGLANFHCAIRAWMGGSREVCGGASQVCHGSLVGGGGEVLEGFFSLMRLL